MKYSKLKHEIDIMKLTHKHESDLLKMKHTISMMMTLPLKDLQALNGMILILVKFVEKHYKISIS